MLSLALCMIAAVPTDDGVLRVLPDRDNTLYETTDGSLSNGAGERLFAGVTASGFLRRTLLRFDVSGIPAGARVTAARLRLTITKEPLFPPSAKFGVYRLLEPWGEGASDALGEEGSGAPSEPGDATWLHREYATTAWASSGGDTTANPSAKVTLAPGLGPAEWSSHALALDVQSWVDGAPNNGWLIRALDEGQPLNAKRFNSREHLDGTTRPLLEVEYELGVMPCGVAQACTTNVASIELDSCSCDAPGALVRMTGAPPGELTYLLVGTGATVLPTPGGDLCLGGAPVGRYALDAGLVDAQGSFTTDVFQAASGGGGDGLPDDAGHLCAPAGQTFGFQYWHRDGGATGLSDAIRVTFR